MLWEGADALMDAVFWQGQQAEDSFALEGASLLFGSVPHDRNLRFGEHPFCMAFMQKTLMHPCLNLENVRLREHHNNKAVVTCRNVEGVKCRGNLRNFGLHLLFEKHCVP